MNRSMITAVLVLLWVAFSSSRIGGATTAQPSEQLKSTVHNYLSADSGYQRGDLITRSHLEDLQLYLRRTQGHSLATHLRWRKRMLPDTAPLAKIFYSEGRPLLRKAAEKLGGYAALDRLSRSIAGQKTLQEAIKKNSTDLLYQTVADEEKKLAANRKNAEDSRTKPSRKQRIYTAADYLSALAAASTPKKETKKKATQLTNRQELDLKVNPPNSTE